jgi:uncharacterized protein YoxC
MPISASSAIASTPSTRFDLVARPRSYSKRPREHGRSRANWQQFNERHYDQQSERRKGGPRESRLRKFLREEKWLVISWAILILYLGSVFIRFSEQANWLRAELRNVQQTLSGKLDEVSVQLNRALDITENTSRDLEAQKTRLQADETDWKQMYNRDENTIQQIRTSLENANKQLREQSTRIEQLEDKNARHGAQIEQMRAIQNMRVAAPGNASAETAPQNQASNQLDQPTAPLVASSRTEPSQSAAK